MRSVISTLVGAATLLAASFAPAIAADDSKEPAFLRVGAGYYDINDNMEAAEFHIEYISSSKWWYFTPFAGFMATTDTALYGYAGIRLDVFFGDHIVLTPSFAPGLYENGDGKDLGHVIEFRSAIELAYRFENRSRLGMSLYHLSNASLDDNNPGTEVLNVHYSLPLNSLFD